MCCLVKDGYYRTYLVKFPFLEPVRNSCCLTATKSI